ncbi:MAG: ribosome-associated translation inhibitor RaiA [Ignavibacteria bacterium]|nr:ribosome-associated translation inhibitor RaiA [Ignavibacteria bacterium]
MNISITARKFKAHETLKDFINDEVSSLKKYNDDILNANVILSYQNPRDSIKTVEITVHIPGQTLNATDDSDDFKKSISSSVDKLSRQLKTLKSKRISH